MKRVGWGLIALGFILALVTATLRKTVSDESADLAMIGFVLAILLGFIALAVSASVRLWKGELKLRPWDAFKAALLYFVVFMTLRIGAWALFADMERDIVKALVLSIAPAVALGFYSTAYRKTA